MKKFVLVMFSTLLVVVFLGFNYLLWDRENKVKNIETLESSNANKEAGMDALSREIKDLQDANRSLQEKINSLTSEKNTAEDEVAKLKKTNLEREGILTEKIALLDELKKIADIKILEQPVRKWAEALDGGDYPTAYGLITEYLANGKVAITEQDYADNCRKAIKSVRIKTVELVKEGEPQNNKGEIIIKASFEVRKTEDSVTERLPLFENGLNELFFTIDYAWTKNTWVIMNIEKKL